MVAIKNPTLKKQFEQFSKFDSDAEKQAFWASFNQDFEAMSAEEQEKMRKAWTENVASIDKRLKTLDKQLDKGISEISVFPANAEEAKLMVALLERMGVRFVVG